MTTTRTIERLLRQQAALANFGSFAFGENDLVKILSEAARICAESLDVPYSKICRYRAEENNLLVVAGYGWKTGVVGHVVSQADESSTQGRAFITGEPVILEDIRKNNSYNLPDFYAQHNVLSTVVVLIKGKDGAFGVLEVGCSDQHTFDKHDINFLTGFANVIAEAAVTTERAAMLQSTLAQMQELIAEKDVLLEERSLFAAELQHRVRNNLQLVYSMLMRQIELTGKDGEQGLRTIALRVMCLANIYDHLLEHGLAQIIDFGAYLESLSANLRDFQDKGDFEISLGCEAVSMPLGLDLVTSLGIIVTEITMNAYLHAFPGRAGNIRIVLTRENDTAVLSISDDGIGFLEKKTSKRHGVGLIKRLIEQVHGTVELTSQQGTAWTITFPVSAKNSPATL